MIRIWKEVTKFWKEKIILPSAIDKDETKSGIRYQREVLEICKNSFKSEVFAAPIRFYEDFYEESSYSFPDPTDININMMPFIVGENFKDCHLPDYLEPYW